MTRTPTGKFDAGALTDNAASLSECSVIKDELNGRVEQWLGACATFEESEVQIQTRSEI